MHESADANNRKILFRQFLQRKTYLLDLREHHHVKQRVTKGPEVAVGNVVVLKNDTKLAIIKEPLTGIDKKVTTDPSNKSKQLRHSIQHLIPIEVKAEESNNSHEQKNNPVVTETRQYQTAAVTGELQRRLQGNLAYGHLAS